MKQFKLFLMMFVATACLCNFTSCKDDDDDDKKKIDPAIVGTWVNISTYQEIRLVLNADGGFIESYTYSGTLGYESETYTGTYTYDGSILTQYYSDGDVYSASASVSGSTLIFDGDTYTRQ